jgi:hypothetical protein
MSRRRSGAAREKRVGLSEFAEKHRLVFHKTSRNTGSEPFERFL